MQPCFILLCAAYSGDDCSADRNGCTSGPGCFIGANCTDNPAPATGATCGPCPSGLTGDGATCSGKLSVRVKQTKASLVDAFYLVANCVTDGIALGTLTGSELHFKYVIQNFNSCQREHYSV